MICGRVWSWGVPHRALPDSGKAKSGPPDSARWLSGGLPGGSTLCPAPRTLATAPASPLGGKGLRWSPHSSAQIPARVHLAPGPCRFPRGDACAPLTRVAEGLQGVQVALRGSPVLPELAAGVRQVPEALPLSPAVPQSTWNWERRAPSRAGTAGRAEKSRGSRRSVPCSAAARRCQPRAVPKLCRALWAAPKFCSSAASRLLSRSGSAPHSPRARSKLSAAREKTRSCE